MALCIPEESGLDQMELQFKLFQDDENTLQTVTVGLYNSAEGIFYAKIVLHNSCTS